MADFDEEFRPNVVGDFAFFEPPTLGSRNSTFRPSTLSPSAITSEQQRTTDEYHISKSLLLLQSDSFGSHYNRVQNVVWRTVEGNNTFGLVLNYVILGLVVATVVFFIASTEEYLAELPAFGQAYWIVTYVAMSIFTLEYLARFWSSTAEVSRFYKRFGLFFGKLLFFIHWSSLIDLIAVAPMYASVIIRETYGESIVDKLVILRMFRLFRLFKADRYLNSITIIFKVVFRKRKELITSLFVMVLFYIFIAGLLYICEGPTNPPFDSIGKCIFWVMISLSTVKGGVGFGTPMTVAGKVIECFMGLACFSSFAVPASILGAGFLEEHQKAAEGKKIEASENVTALEIAKREEKRKVREERRRERTGGENRREDDYQRRALLTSSDLMRPPTFSDRGGSSPVISGNSNAQNDGIEDIGSEERAHARRKVSGATARTDESSLMIKSGTSHLVFFCPHCRQSSEVQLSLM